MRSSHPWEDWAETWAHYLHIVDTLETARAFRLRVDPKAAKNDDLSAEVDFDVYADIPIQTIMDAWLPLSFAINSLNRSMGQNDAYPFVLSAGVIEKLNFVHHVVRPHALGLSDPLFAGAARSAMIGPGKQRRP